MLNSTIWTYATRFVGKVCSPLWSTWGTPLGEGKSGVKAGMVPPPFYKQGTFPHRIYLLSILLSSPPVKRNLIF